MSAPHDDPAEAVTASADEPGRPERHTLFWMDMTREGDWPVPAQMEIRGTRTNVRLDLTGASFAAAEVVIDFALYNSGAEVVVGPDVEVVVAPKSFTAPEDAAVTPGDDDPQVVVVTGYARLGGKGVRITRA